MSKDETLEQLVSDVFKNSQTFSEDMILKVREQLLTMAKDCEKFYNQKAEENVGPPL